MTDVAVVIPCYNAAPWLSATLESVLGQTHRPTEVVVVDDGSTDGSAEIAEAAGARVERQDRGGPGAARNRGVAVTEAPLVAFLDADDCFLPDKLAAQVAHLERTGAVASCTDAWVVEDGMRTGRKSRGREIPARLTFDRLLETNPVICSSVLAQREVLGSVGGFDEDPVLVATEDYDLWLRVARHGDLAYLDEPLVDYRMTPGQLSDDGRFLAGIDRIMEKVLAEDPGLAEPAHRRKALVRIDLAYRLARTGRGAEARSRLREARRLGRGGWPAWKIWIRSLLA